MISKTLIFFIHYCKNKEYKIILKNQPVYFWAKILF